MKNVLLGLMLLFVTFSVEAQDKKNKNAKYTFEVKGNCEQCQRRIHKAAFSVAGVKSAFWEIDSEVLTVVLNENKCSVQDVKKAIAGAGHDVVNEFNATKEVYKKLPKCCQYDKE